MRPFNYDTKTVHELKKALHQTHDCLNFIADKNRGTKVETNLITHANLLCNELEYRCAS